MGFEAGILIVGEMPLRFATVQHDGVQIMLLHGNFVAGLQRRQMRTMCRGVGDSRVVELAVRHHVSLKTVGTPDLEE